jgi:hypothetical protein
MKIHMPGGNGQVGRFLSATLQNQGQVVDDLRRRWWNLIEG